MSKGSGCGDVLIVPLGLAGHVNPLMYLGKKLMERGLSVTIVISEDDKALVEGYTQEGGGSGGLFTVEVVMSIRTVKGGDTGLLGNSTNFGRVCEPFLKSVQAEREATGQGPKCMIVDQFMGWTQTWANKLNIPRYVFLVSPASYGLFMYNYSSLLANGLLDHEDEDPAIEFPGVPVLHLSDFPGSSKRNPAFVASSGDTFGEADGILFNSFYELESAAIKAFGAQVDETPRKVPKMLPVGPMLPAEFFSEDMFDGTAKDSECIQWLNTRPPSSVVYIAFGSTVYLSPPQIQELACGLEASHVPFLWVLRVKSSQSNSEDVTKLLPPGFQARTKDRGLIYTNFSPQLQILSNPAVGGFFSHCGWNSSLESICKGIPMVGWPMRADQRLCCRILVDQSKVAVDVKTGPPELQEVVDRVDIERALSLLMTQSEGSDLKMRALELQVLARAAVAPGGSSRRSFEVLLNDIQGRKSMTRQAQG